MELGERKVPGPGRAALAAVGAVGEFDEEFDDEFDEEFDEGGVEYRGVPGATRVPLKGGRKEREIM